MASPLSAVPTASLPLLDRLADDERFSSSVIRDLLAHARRPDVISMAGGLPAEELLPIERVAVAAQRILSERGAAALQYGLSAGEAELRSVVAPDVDPDRIVITAGSQQALDLVARLMAHPRSATAGTAAIEDPGYLGAVQILRSHRYELAGIPVDADGLRVDVLSQRLSAGLRPRLCYLNPTHQNPTGASLSTERAVRLVELAEHYDFVVIADDPYVELTLDGPSASPVPPSPNVVRLGSASKVVAPGLRIGWADADPRLTSRLVLGKQAADLHTSTANQLLVAEIMSDRDWWEAHLEALRGRYRVRRGALTDAVARHLPDAVVTRQRGGFFLWVDVGRDVSDLLSLALDNGVAFVPGAAFAVDTQQPTTLRLSYSSGDPDRFDEAVARLARSIESLAVDSRGTTHDTESRHT